jgi:hypothetical protein
MAVAGSWRVYGSISGLPQGTEALDVSIATVPTSVGGRTVVTVNGFSNLTALTPAAATAVCVIPPSANANTITLKGVTGDTGIALSKTQPTVIALTAGATWGITTGASTVLTLVFM